MPVTVLPPDVIEWSDFSGGYMPDPEDAALPENAFSDLNNLLPDRKTGSLKTRDGFRRYSTFELANPKKAKALYSYNIGYGSSNELGKQYLIVQSTDGTPAANNVRIDRINVQDSTTARIDDSGREWRGPVQAHWGVTIDNTYYGGSELDPIYSWRPYFANGDTNPDAWDPDATMPQWANAWATSTVYTKGDRRHHNNKVWICTVAHTSSSANEPSEGKNASDFWEPSAKYKALWGSGNEYTRGDIITYETANSNLNYPRNLGGRTSNVKSAFIATRTHTSTAGNYPTSGSGLWEAYRGPISNVAIYHGSRLWARDSDAGTSRIRYSAQVKADGLWDNSDWSVAGVDGPGWIDIRTGDGDDVRALHELGNMLIICKRRSTHVLTGLNPSTWTLRQISDKGGLYKRAICEHEGFVYFFGDQGLFQTDGAIVQEAPGAENLRDYMRTSLDLEGNNIYKITMTSFEGFIWFSFHEGEGSGSPNVTLVYDPVTSSFWPQDFGTRQFAVNRVSRIDEMFFLARQNSSKPALVMQYNKSNDNNKDDGGDSAYAGVDIAWHARTGWYSMGVAKQERMLRRCWTMVRGASKDFTVKAYKNFSESVVWTVNTTASAAVVNWLEGRVIETVSALSFRVSGTSAPCSLLGFALHTQARRSRYHRGTQT